MFSLLLDVPEIARNGDFNRSCFEVFFGKKFVPRFAGVVNGGEAGIFGNGLAFGGKDGFVVSTPFRGGAS